MFRKALSVAVLLLAGAVAGLLAHAATTSGETVFAGKRPSNLGVKDGRLAAPRKTPNCVSSQADPADAGHYIAPIAFQGDPVQAILALRRIADSMERTHVVAHDPEYLYVEFRSKLMGFVDDVEFFASAAEGVIHVRSSSRLGRRDFGVNRERVEAIRARFGAARSGARQA